MAPVTATVSLRLFLSSGIPVLWQGTVVVVRSKAARRKGLMHRTSLSPKEGMLFVYPRAQPLYFWMRNTPLELLLVGLDAACNVTAVRPLHALDDTVVSVGYGTAALELPRLSVFAKLLAKPVTGQASITFSLPHAVPFCPDREPEL